MKVYFPTHGIDVPASPPHPVNTHYRVSRGVEHWEGGIETHKVIKVQMVYNGAVSGRRSPSFPVGTDDAKRVMKAIVEVEKGGGKTLRGESSSL